MRSRNYPDHLLRTTKLQTTARFANLPLPKGYHFHNLTLRERKSASTIKKLSGICDLVINRTWAQKHLKSALLLNNCIVVTHGTKKQIVAFIIFKTRGKLGHRQHYIDLVCTRAAHQGKGIGTLLMQHVILLFMRSSPQAGIFLQTWKEKNTYYEKLGFSRVKYSLGHASSSRDVTKSVSASSSEVLGYMKLTRGLAVYRAMAREMNRRILK